MIYILSGNDFKKRKAYLDKLAEGRNVTRLFASDVSSSAIMSLAQDENLFGEKSIAIIDGAFKEAEIDFSKDELATLKNSETIFTFLEDKLLAATEKKYTKLATIEKFEEKKIITAPKPNTFAIANSFGNRDKIGTWVLYLEAVESGAEPEAISGMLFWKIKNMLIAGSKNFTEAELKNQSKKIVSLYHDAHLGELDFTIGLEQFILSNLNK